MLGIILRVKTGYRYGTLVVLALGEIDVASLVQEDLICECKVSVEFQGRLTGAPNIMK